MKRQDYLKWDEYFMGIALLSAQRSKDPSTSVGCCIVSKDNKILSVGYNEENSLYHEVEFDVPEIYLLGDAKKVANIMYAIWDAFEVANHI